MVTEVDSDLALQAAMGYEVVTMEQAAPKADIFVTATGNRDVITIDHMREMKDRAIVCNIGHFDNEIQVAALNNYPWSEVKPQVDEIEFPDGKRMILLARAVGQSGMRHWSPVICDVSVFYQSGAGADGIMGRGEKYENKVYTLPRHLDEKVAALHFAKVGATLSQLRPDRPTTLALNSRALSKANNIAINRHAGCPPRVIRSCRHTAFWQIGDAVTSW